jgi:hypothetical protein
MANRHLLLREAFVGADASVVFEKMLLGRSAFVTPVISVTACAQKRRKNKFSIYCSAGNLRLLAALHRMQSDIFVKCGAALYLPDFISSIRAHIASGVPYDHNACHRLKRYQPALE